MSKNISKRVQQNGSDEIEEIPRKKKELVCYFVVRYYIMNFFLIEPRRNATKRTKEIASFFFNYLFLFVV